MPFRVTLDVFHGPLDLLLHLVRKQEVGVADVRLADVTQQFLDHVAVLEELDIDSIGDFLEVASLLVEIKSRQVLPQADEVADDEVVGPKQDLVERLLEFKKYRDAAQRLEERGHEWRRRFARAATDAPPTATPPEEQPIVGVELWDLVSAFGRLMQEKLEPPPPQTIPYDDTPVHVFVRRVYDRLAAEGETRFSALFDGSVHKSTLIATFLAVLELVRHGHARVEQSDRYGDLVLRPGPKPLDEGAPVELTADVEPTTSAKAA